MKEQDGKLIRTHGRERLPAALSYPATSTAISAALQGVPQFDALVLHFRARPTLFASDFQRRLTRGLPVPAVRLTYWHHAVSMSAPRHVPLDNTLYGEHWDLDVLGVPRQHRRAVAVELIRHGLKRLRAWLQEPRPDTWRTGIHIFALMYSLPELTVTAREATGSNAHAAILA
jgi:hypothetical protein